MVRWTSVWCGMTAQGLGVHMLMQHAGGVHREQWQHWRIQRGGHSETGSTGGVARTAVWAGERIAAGCPHTNSATPMACVAYHLIRFFCFFCLANKQ